jgi:hypothetical protein
VKYQIRLLRVTGCNQEVIIYSYAYQLLSYHDICMDSIFDAKTPIQIQQESVVLPRLSIVSSTLMNPVFIHLAYVIYYQIC